MGDSAPDRTAQIGGSADTATTADFNLAAVFSSVAAAIPDATMLTWRNRQLTYGAVDVRVDGFSHYLVSLGLGCHTERGALAGHESGQDHVALYLRNGNEYLEAMIGSFRARLAPFNCSYRYVESELHYLLSDARAAVVVYNAEFAPRIAAVRHRLPHLRVLIQVADDSGHELLPGAVDYETILTTPQPSTAMPAPSGDDLYILYTGGTTGMPKGVLWRQNDIFVSSMGGRPFGSETPFTSYAQLAEQARRSAGATSILMIPPLIHGAAQWAAFHTITLGGRIVIPDHVDRLRPAEALRTAQREKVSSLPVVGDAIARPLLDELETRRYDLSALVAITNGGAALSPHVRERLRDVLPHIVLIDGVGSSESGTQMADVTVGDVQAQTATFAPQSDTAVVTSDFDRVLTSAGSEGWLARRDLIPLGYLLDAAKSARTFPTIDGVRWSVPGDRARILADGRIELLGRDSATINSGGEKVFAEEVERAVTAHPGVYDAVVVGRPSPRWGSEIVAVIQLADGAAPSDQELIVACRERLARYKVPKAFIRTPTVKRSPAGKADYRWANALVTKGDSP